MFRSNLSKIMSNSYGMWGKPIIIAISLSIIIGTVGIYFSPAIAGGFACGISGNFDICFDNVFGLSTWLGNSNDWEPDNFPVTTDRVAIGEVTDAGIPPYDVVIASPSVVDIGDGVSSGSLEIFDLNTLTVGPLATLNINVGADPALTLQPLATLTIEGTVTNDFNILNNGLIECVGVGTLVDLGSITGSGTVTGCGGAAVGSISIPIDSTPMLVAGNQMNSIWITLAIAAAVGIAILIIRRN